MNTPALSKLEEEKAPWNEDIPEEREFEMLLSQSLSKIVNVFTEDYNPEIEEDEDGKHTVYDTSDTHWEEVYHDNDHYTPLQLITMFKNYLEHQLSKGLVYKNPKYTEHLIEECSNWHEDEVEYYKED